MSKAPGHAQWPDHRISERPLSQRVRATLGEHVLADSRNVLEVAEDKNPVRYYFPRADVRMEQLEPSVTTSVCPFKGTASYFDVNAGGQKLRDAVWSYERPYDEHRGLEGRLAFYDDKYRDIVVRVESA